MSSMLEQAIIDAKQLRETAHRTAEEAVIERYQSEIKEAVNKILEQEDSMLEEEEDEAAASFIEELPGAQLAEEDDVVEINLDKLEELMAEELEEGEMDASDLTDRHQVAEEIEALTEEGEELEVELDESLDELLEDEALENDEIEINEENLAAMISELLGEELGTEEEKAEAEEEESEAAAASATGDKTTDVKALEEVEDVEELEEEKKEMVDHDNDPDTPKVPSYAADGKGTKDLKKESTQLQKENKSLLREQKLTNKKVQILQEKVDKYGTVIKKLETKLNESNLTNAKLLYQNRILNSISLNERQKDKIVEAIENATTVEEAKIIFETLQSAVGLKSKKTRKQESLNEVVTRSSSAFIPRKEVKPQTDVFSDRMKRLAGLK